MIDTFCGETEFHGTIYGPVNGSLYMEFQSDESDQFPGFQAEVRVAGKCSFPISFFVSLVEVDSMGAARGQVP